MNTDNENPSNILIIRLSAIGDVVMASPLIGSFRRTYPEARISWLVDDGSKDILLGHPDIDEIIIWPRSAWRSLLREKRLLKLAGEITAFMGDLRRKPRFDLVLDAQGLLKSGFWAFVTGAKERIGLGSAEGSRYFMTRVIDLKEPDGRISFHYLQCAEELGLHAGDFRMSLATGGEEDRFALEFAEEFRVEDGYAALCPFTTRPQKHWRPERWSEIIGRLSENYGLTSVLLGGPGDQATADDISAHVNRETVNLVGKTTLKQVAAIIKHASLLIGVDTGLTHMGTAFLVPTVALFGSTCPYTRTYSPRTAVIYSARECSPCRRHPDCDDTFDCMVDIEVEDVLDSVKKVFAN